MSVRCITKQEGWKERKKEGRKEESKETLKRIFKRGGNQPTSSPQTV